MTQVTKAASTNSIVSGSWQTVTNAYGTTGDNSYATLTDASRNGAFTIRYGFAGFTSGDIPDGATINWVRVDAEVSLTQSIGSIIQITLHNPAGTAVGNAASTSATTDTLIQSTSTTHPTLTNLRDGVVVADLLYDRANSTTSETARIDYVSITVDYTASQPNQYTESFSGQTPTLSFTGAFSRLLSAGRSLTGSLSFSAALATVKSVGKNLTGALSFTAGLVKFLNRSESASLSFTVTFDNPTYIPAPSETPALTVIVYYHEA